MKKVLFIVYYFPPMGGSGVQRPLKFVKYLPYFGWQPLVIAPESGAYHTFDTSLQDELVAMNLDVHRVTANTPFHLLGNKSREISFIPEKIAVFLRRISSFFWLPDNKTGWINPAVRKAKELWDNEGFDLIFSTAAPYSNHLIAAVLGQKYKVPVVMDFRDEWLESHLITYPTQWHRKRMGTIERECLLQADMLTVVSQSMKESFQSRVPKSIPIEVLPHGFDPDDFTEADGKSHIHSESDKFRILYSGMLYGENDPGNFFEAIAELLVEYPEFNNKIELIFQGGLDRHYHEKINKCGLTPIVQDLGYLPHKEAVSNLFKADLLWLLLAFKNNPQTVTVGKLFEYMATKKPILGILDDGASASILKNYGAGFLAKTDDIASIKEKILELLRLWEQSKLPSGNESVIQQYDRKKITERLAALFDGFV